MFLLSSELVMDDTTEQKKELDEPEESTDIIADEVKEENSTKTSNDVLPDTVDSDCSKSKDDNKEIKNDTDAITNAEDEKPEEKQQNENDDKSTENKTKNDDPLTSAEEKANSETEETDELQLIYKGLTDPSLSSKKIPDKLVESTSSAVTTKNLIEFLEDESDIQVENSSTLKSDDSFLNIRAAEKTSPVSDQPMEVEQEEEKTSADDKIVTVPTTTVRRIPSLVLTRLDDEIEQFADKPFYEKIKTALKLLKGEKAIVKEPPAIVSKASVDCDTAIKKEEVNNNSNNDVEFLEKIDVVKVEPVEEENVDFERIDKTNNDSLLDNKENEAVPPVENVPKRRGRKKGVHYTRTPITHDKGYDEDYKMSREPVKFSMQTRKRKLKFLPDGSLVSHKYSPPSSRIDSGDSSGSENDSEAEFNESSLNEEPPAKRKYVRKSSTIQSSTPVLGIKRGPGRPPKNRSFDFETYCKNRMSGKPLPYEVEKPLDECLNEDDASAIIKKRYSGAIDPASIMTYLINERITLSRMNSHKFPLVVDKDKRDMQLYKQFTTCHRSSVVRLTSNNNVDGNDSKLQRGHITTSNKSASISYEIMKTRDKLKAINFDHSRQFGDIIIPKNLDQPVKYGIQIPNGSVIRKSTPGKFGSIVPIEKPKVQSPLPNNSNDNNNNNKSTLSTEDNSDNKTTSTKKSGLGQLFRDMAKDADTDEPSSKKPNDNLAVNNSEQHANKDNNEKETEDENSLKMDCENSSETNFWPLKKDSQQSSTSSVSLPICLNREDIRKKESRTVKTTRGPKKALKQPANDEDDDTYIYNISDADDTMLKLVTEHLQMSAKSRSIYDLMEEITLQMPTWNLHIMPDKSSFCIAQVARGRMGIPILKKSIELDTNFSAKVYVHQLHCKRYDGTYNDEHSLVNLIREIDSLSA